MNSKTEELLNQFEKLAPLSVQAMSRRAYEVIVPLYLAELQPQADDPFEYFFYMPAFLKKHIKAFKYPPHIPELADYEFVKHHILHSQIQKPSSVTSNEIYWNPIAQALQHLHDIHNYALNFDPKVNPEQKKTLLLITKKTSDLVFLNANPIHAAIIDELHDGKIKEIVLIKMIQAKFLEFNLEDINSAMNELKDHGFVLAT